MNEKELDFYKNCAVSALQGLMESGLKVQALFDLMPETLSKRAFDFADAMLEEYRKRTTNIYKSNN